MSIIHCQCCIFGCVNKSWCALAAADEVPDTAAEALRAIVTGFQSVTKGRQEPDTANDVQVSKVFAYLAVLPCSVLACGVMLMYAHSVGCMRVNAHQCFKHVWLYFKACNR